MEQENKTVEIEKVKLYIVKLRGKLDDVLKNQAFCNEHNFKLEAQSEYNKATILRQIILEMESTFDIPSTWNGNKLY